MYFSRVQGEGCRAKGAGRRVQTAMSADERFIELQNWRGEAILLAHT